MSTQTEVTYLPDRLDTVILNSVARGARWLDRRQSNWYRHVFFKDLDMSSGKECILGQLGAYLGTAPDGRPLRFNDFFPVTGWQLRHCLIPENVVQFIDGCHYLVPLAHLALTEAQSKKLGFDLPESVSTWSADHDYRFSIVWTAMDEAWKAEIRQRRQAPKS